MKRPHGAVNGYSNGIGPPWSTECSVLNMAHVDAPGSARVPWVDDGRRDVAR